MKDQELSEIEKAKILLQEEKTKQKEEKLSSIMEQMKESDIMLDSIFNTLSQNIKNKT